MMRPVKRCLGVAAILVGTLVLPAVSWSGSTSDTCRAHGRAALEAWTHGHSAQMNQYFAPEIASKVDADQWQRLWQKLHGHFGDLQDVGDFQSTTMAGRKLLAARVTFAQSTQALLLACDDQNRIRTFRMARVPGMNTADVAPVPSDVVTRDVQVETPLGPLPGTLSLPAGDGPFPAVVLVQGSGPQDRDESIGPNKPFRDIAIGLAQAGVASLRYDKRTRVYPQKMSRNQGLTVDDEVTDDALSALQTLTDSAGIDARHVFVLGHSLGAMLAPRIAQRSTGVAGVIMLAAPARSFLDVVSTQVQELGPRQGKSDEEIAAQQTKIRHEQKLLAHATSTHPPEGGYAGLPQSYMLSLHNYDQVGVAKNLDVPMLILQGKADFQVSPADDFGRWKQALGGRDNVTLHAWPDLNHLFMPAGDTSTPADYNKPGHVDADAIQYIASWITAHANPDAD